MRERLLDEIDERDVACDARWRACTTERALVAQGEDVRRKTRSALGGFPETKCPLNARVTRQVARDGYRVEMVMYESWPGVHVTANLFLPDNPKFAPPYPALLLACGHAQVGKGSPAYQRGAVLAATTEASAGAQGVPRLTVWDREDAGERRDVPELARQLGRSVPGLQATEILVLAEEAKRTFGRAPVVCAVGRLCVAAAHARKVRPDLARSVPISCPPWNCAIRRRAGRKSSRRDSNATGTAPSRARFASTTGPNCCRPGTRGNGQG